MDVVLFRHAKKAFAPFEDPHLSDDGFRQGLHLPQTLKQFRVPPPTEIWVSEKIRTKQTMQAVAEEHHLPMIVRAELNVRGDHEGGQEFLSRIHKMIDEITLSARKNTTNVYYLCSHYDWIEEAMSIIPCDRNLNTFEFSHWAPAQFVRFAIESDTWKFVSKGVQP